MIAGIDRYSGGLVEVILTSGSRLLGTVVWVSEDIVSIDQGEDGSLWEVDPQSIVAVRNPDNVG